MEKDLLENVGFLSNKGKGYSSHRNWTKTVITSVIGAALAEAQADPTSNSLVQSQPDAAVAIGSIAQGPCYFIQACSQDNLASCRVQACSQGSTALTDP